MSAYVWAVLTTPGAFIVGWLYGGLCATRNYNRDLAEHNAKLDALRDLLEGRHPPHPSHDRE